MILPIATNEVLEYSNERHETLFKSIENWPCKRLILIKLIDWN